MVNATLADLFRLWMDEYRKAICKYKKPGVVFETRTKPYSVCTDFHIADAPDLCKKNELTVSNLILPGVQLDQRRKTEPEILIQAI